jgi:hypothetical protein
VGLPPNYSIDQRKKTKTLSRRFQGRTLGLPVHVHRPPCPVQIEDIQQQHRHRHTTYLIHNQSINMAGFFRTCRDGHRCEYGSTCVEAPNEEGSYFCDCSTAAGDFAGLFCEYEAENYCTFRKEVESSFFCTNRGTCVLASDSSDWRCDCPDNYDGPVSIYIIIIILLVCITSKSSDILSDHHSLYCIVLYLSR